MSLPSPFEITTVAVDGAVFVTVSGELDLQTAPELYEVLTEQSVKTDNLVLDLGGLDFIDSSGIRVVLIAWQESQRDGFALRLTRGSDPVMRAFQLVGLMDELPFLGRS
jgi:anti-sigma B factor antagonist